MDLQAWLEFSQQQIQQPFVPQPPQPQPPVPVHNAETFSSNISSSSGSDKLTPAMLLEVAQAVQRDPTLLRRVQAISRDQTAQMQRLERRRHEHIQRGAKRMTEARAAGVDAAQLDSISGRMCRELAEWDRREVLAAVDQMVAQQQQQLRVIVSPRLFPETRQSPGLRRQRRLVQLIGDMEADAAMNFQ